MSTTLRSVSLNNMRSKSSSSTPSLPLYSSSSCFSRLKPFGSIRNARTSTLTRHSTYSLRMAESSSPDSRSNCSSLNSDYAEIIVVRHGETAWNADRRIQGHLDVELNDAGRQQAAAVADRLSREPKISIIYSSDLRRAFEAAQIIATSCGGPEVAKDPKLRERIVGDLQGLGYREAAKTNPIAYKAFVSET